MARHHIKRGPGETCPLCEEKILECHPDVVAIWSAVRPEFLDAHISWGFRPKEAQDRFVEEGRSWAVWPNSRHNRMKDGRPCAEAIDLFRLRPDGVAEWRLPYFQRIHEFLVSRSVPHEWGGSWPKPKKDGPHFQMTGGVAQG